VSARRIVVIDGRMAKRRPTGAATYIRSLQAALAAYAPDDLDIRVRYGPGGLPRRNKLTSVGNLMLDLAWQHAIFPALARKDCAAAVHAPFNWAPRWSPCPTIVTVQDLAWERVPETFPPAFRRYARLFTRQSARHAARVITTSEATARDLTALYSVPSGKIRTIPIGITPDPTPSSGPRESIILAVGEFEPRKRILELVAAHQSYFRDTPADPTPCRLVLVGGGGRDEEAVRAAAGPECDVLGFVDRPTLLDLYRRATLLVYPSSYEGFGLPVLEAMAHGCPALIARNSSLPEVGGDAALYIETPTIEGIATALGDALGDRAALADRGAVSRAHADRFAWLRVAEQTSAVYREAIDA
jgi:glycosyltransferase involved in cell wall biosynthesis